MLSNQCQLISYPDSLGGDLATLEEVLSGELGAAIAGLHILPFYPSSADRGFAPISYRQVEQRFGNWAQVERLAQSYELTVDFMVNHISRRAPCFSDFLARKEQSPWATMFIRYADFWPNGEPTAADLARIYTRKARPPWVEVEFADGSREKLWCTFDAEQIDLDLRSAITRRFMRDTLLFLCDRGAKLIRLDAVAYATKRVGSNCFFVEPDIWELLEFASDGISGYDTELLPEVHERYRFQQALAARGYLVYDFALPMLVLQALYDGDSSWLSKWLAICPRRQITTLDTHDGIGVVDVHGLLPKELIERTRDRLYGRGGIVKQRYSGAAYHNLDVYQINCTYFSALENREQAYLLARAIQFFAPGIPQLYYVGLLAGANDIQLVERTKLGRDINRHGYSRAEAEAACKRSVVQRLLRLMRFRNESTAFAGRLEIAPTEPHLLSLLWRNGAHTARLDADLRTHRFSIQADGITINI